MKKMSSCPEVEAVVAQLEWGDVSVLGRLGELEGRDECVVEGLTSAAGGGDWERFERYVLVSARYPSALATDVLCQVLGRRLADINNEDIIDALAAIGDPAAVSVLEDSILWQPEWDEFDSIGVKAVWALADIGTPEALEILRGFAVVGPTKIREAAAQKLRVGDC